MLTRTGMFAPRADLRALEVYFWLQALLGHSQLCNSSGLGFRRQRTQLAP
jgi:hypothetical protein